MQNDLSLLHLLNTIRKTSAVFTYDEFGQVKDTLTYIKHVQAFFQHKPNRDEFPRLTEAAGGRVYVDPELLERLSKAFEGATGQLSAKAYPVLGTLRASISSKKSQIQSTLASLTSNLPPSSLPSDGSSTVSSLNGRYTISVSPTAMRRVGILHSRSRTSKTVYVEPFEVIEATNDLITLQEDLEREERRILRTLTADVIAEYDDVKRSLLGCGLLDAVRGKALHSLSGGCVVPAVESGGVLRVVAGRHPTVPGCAPNDVSLGCGENRGLVISGPNAGGKTVVIKMMAVMALMVRDGLALPAGEGTRVDFFERVMADIGDGQSLGGSMSTFQAHVHTLGSILSSSSSCSGPSLVVLDEIGSGTSPDQGVALARAVVEGLVSLGARVAATTHFTEMKCLAAGDGRFEAAGMQFLDGRPTYRLEMGAVGESFALAVAERMGLPGEVLERAGELMSRETREMSELVRAMEEDKDRIRKGRVEMERRLREAEDMKSDLEEKERQLEATKRAVRQQEARKFARVVEEKERALEALLSEMRERSERSGNGVKVVGKTWSDLKLLKREVHGLAAGARAQEGGSEADGLAPLGAKDDIKVGQLLLVSKKGSPFYGKTGSVIGLSGKNLVELSVGALSSRFKRADLSLAGDGGEEQEAGGAVSAAGGRMKVSKRVMREAEEGKAELRAAGRKKKGGAKKMMRMDGNSIDVRGMESDDAMTEVRGFFSRMIGAGRGCVYILHGHGSGGVLKRKVREALRREALVEKYGPAEDEDGGDAYTCVFLKDLL